MTRIAFFTFPLAGHVNPQIGLVQALAQEGAELLIYSTREHASKFAGMERVRCKEYPEQFVRYFQEINRKKEIHHQYLIMLAVFYRQAELLIDFCIEEIAKEQPDALVCDQFSIWGRAAGRYHKRPVIKFFSSILADANVGKSQTYMAQMVAEMVLKQGSHFFRLKRSQKAINRKYGPICENVTEIMAPGDGLCVVMTSKKFHPGGEAYGDHILFVGADHERTLAKPQRKDKILISLGSVSLREGFFDACIEATQDIPLTRVITLAGNPDHQVEHLRGMEGVEIHENLDFKAYRNAMNESALFISHGGFNGVTMALLYETPQIVCPASPEQVNNGILLKKYRCGDSYDSRKPDIRTLREKAKALLFNREVEVALAEQSHALVHSLGYRGTARRIMETLHPSACIQEASI